MGLVIFIHPFIAPLAQHAGEDVVAAQRQGQGADTLVDGSHVQFSRLQTLAKGIKAIDAGGHVALPVEALQNLIHVADTHLAHQRVAGLVEQQQAGAVKPQAPAGSHPGQDDAQDLVAVVGRLHIVAQGVEHLLLVERSLFGGDGSRRLQGDGRLLGEAGDDIQVEVRPDVALPGHSQKENGVDAIGRKNRGGQRRAEAAAGEEGVDVGGVGVVGAGLWPARLHHLAQQPCAVLNAGLQADVFQPVGGGQRQFRAIGVVDEQAADAAMEQLHRLAHRFRQELGWFADGADVARGLLQRGQEIAALAGLFIQLGVLDGHGDLGGQQLAQAFVFAAEAPRVADGVDAERADHFFNLAIALFNTHLDGRDEGRLNVILAQHLVSNRPQLRPIGHAVNAQRLAAQHPFFGCHAAHRNARARWRQAGRELGLNGAAFAVGVEVHQPAVFGAEDLHRRFAGAPHHVTQIERRGHIDRQAQQRPQVGRLAARAAQQTAVGYGDGQLIAQSTTGVEQDRLEGVANVGLQRQGPDYLRPGRQGKVEAGLTIAAVADRFQAQPVALSPALFATRPITLLAVANDVLGHAGA